MLTLLVQEPDIENCCTTLALGNKSKPCSPKLGWETSIGGNGKKTHLLSCYTDQNQATAEPSIFFFVFFFFF